MRYDRILDFDDSLEGEEEALNLNGDGESGIAIAAASDTVDCIIVVLVLDSFAGMKAMAFQEYMPSLLTSLA